MLFRLCAVTLLAATLAGCDKCGNFLGSQACRSDVPRQQ
jgi:hypothetical protein